MKSAQLDRTSNQHWVSVGQLDNIPMLGSRRIVINDRRIALFRTRDNKVFALLDQCPHAQGPLSDGIVHGNCVTCPLHNWVISLDDGAAQGADSGSTETFAVRVEDGEILLNTVAQKYINPQPIDPMLASAATP